MHTIRFDVTIVVVQVGAVKIYMQHNNKSGGAEGKGKRGCQNRMKLSFVLYLLSQLFRSFGLMIIGIKQQYMYYFYLIPIFM